MKVLLISPRSEDDVYSELIREIPYVRYMSGKKMGTYLPPHALATVAALTPADCRVEIHDEHVRGPVEPVLAAGEYDIIGLSMLTNQLKRTTAIAEHCRREKLPATLVVGGPGTTNMPEGLDKLFKVIFIGEAEETWPQFIRDFKDGSFKSVYQQISKPDPSLFPIPRWELIRNDLPFYGGASVQTSRGCPYDCTFCDVIYIYGRKMRCKPAEQVVEEIRMLQGMGVKFILIADDNFGCRRRYAKECLRKIVKLNNSFDIPLRFLAQVDVTIADDEELLELMADANVFEVLVGIESSSEDSLKDLHKLQNTKRDLAADVRKIQSYGIIVLGSLIIGADSDDPSAFQRTLDFVKEANITDHSCHPLMAPYGTKLWYDLKRQGRLVTYQDEQWKDRMDVLTNIVPKSMSRIELMQGIAEYWEKSTDPLHYMGRAIGFIKGVRRFPKVQRPKFRALLPYLQMMLRMFWYYLFEVSAAHRKAFFAIVRTARKHAPGLLPNLMFLHTCFMINHKRAVSAAALARKRAAWENEHPDQIKAVDRSLPVPQKVRDRATELVSAAYAHVRKHIADRETLYRIVTKAMVDYVDRFGASFKTFDEDQQSHLSESCDRILAGPLNLPGGKPGGSGKELPADRPPPGFPREILDAVDQTIRIAQSLSPRH